VFREPGDRRGTTLIEVVVALFVLTVGLLALAGVGATVTRLTERGGRQTRAAALLPERLESLRSHGCAAAPGEEIREPFRVRWSFEPAPGGRRATVRILAPGLSAPGALSISRFIACRE